MRVGEVDQREAVARRRAPRPDQAPAPLSRETAGTAGTTVGRILGATLAGSLQRSAGNRAVAAILRPKALVVHRQIGLPGHPVLRRGASGPDVDELQTLLNGAGAAPPLIVNGTFDLATHRAVQAFQRAHGLRATGVAGHLTWGALDRLAGTAAVPAPGPDTHADAALPDTGERTAIRAELNPASAGPAGTVRPWDGRGNSATARAKRALLKTEVTTALNAMLTGRMPAIHAAAAARHLPMTQFEGAGVQAKRVTDDVFGTLVSGAALTPGQRAGRAAFAFTAGANLLDASDPAVRTPDPDDLATWMAETDTAAAAAQASHGFDKNRSAVERRFLIREILNPFVAAHRADLELFDRFGFAFAEPGPRVLSQPHVIATPTHSDTAPAPGVPSRAERLAKWQTWETLVHEYLHTLAHPAFVAAERGRRVMSEGFCELFTKEVLSTQIPTAQADGDADLRGGVEGRPAPGALFPGFTSDLVPDYDAGEYADYLAHAEAIVSALGGRGADAVRAAYFHGHVELIGLTPSGGQAAAARRSDDDLVTVPSSVRTVFALSVMTAVDEADILAANPVLTATGPLPARVHVPGTRKHVVVASDERTPSGALRARAVETRAEIADQNGVTEADLNRANPDLDWRRLRPGLRILIPKH